MNAILTGTETMGLAHLGSAWLHIGHGLALAAALVCYIRWICSRRGSWMIGVGAASAWLLFSHAHWGSQLVAALWLHAVWIAFRYARSIHDPCPHHSRLPRPWRRFACGNLLRCRTCHMLYPLGLLVLAMALGILLLCGTQALAHCRAGI